MSSFRTRTITCRRLSCCCFTTGTAQKPSSLHLDTDPHLLRLWVGFGERGPVSCRFFEGST